MCCEHPARPALHVTHRHRMCVCVCVWCEQPNIVSNQICIFVIGESTVLTLRKIPSGLDSTVRSTATATPLSSPFS